MEILPSEYQQIELSRSEKIFVRNMLSSERYGFLLIKTNPAMLKNESMHTLVCSDGVLHFKFFDGINDPANFNFAIPLLIDTLYAQTVGIISTKLLSNKALVDDTGKLRFPVNLIYVFPELQRKDVAGTDSAKLGDFIKNACLFKEDLPRFRTGLDAEVSRLLTHSIVTTSKQKMDIINENVNSVLQRIAPEYVTIRVSAVTEEERKAGVDNELLVVTEDDAAVKAFRLDAEQVNIVNKIVKGEQLILACAGSGKSVLLIAKCFKAATMNPDKQFLITCYNSNLYSLYTWFIDRAGLRAKNVTCLTFHTLCKNLLNRNGFHTQNKDFDGWVSNAIARLNAGQIKERFYGIFIDEVQQFNLEWYKFCYNLLENKASDNHLFVICGDKTQKLANLQRHGRAPWNAGEGYPIYRGGNKNIRIERNYRNCIEINEYINHYVSNAKQYLFSVQQNTDLDPDEFLRGKSVFHGPGVTIKHLTDSNNQSEAKAVAESIRMIHDESGIPYDEIAVIMFNKRHLKKFPGWGNRIYNLEGPLTDLLEQNDIPHCAMYNSDTVWSARYGDDGGIRLITFQSVLGLDFRAAIVCGLLPLGVHDGTKKPDWSAIQENKEVFEDALKDTKNNIRFLYVACTRAKEILHVILPETGETSVYINMLETAQ